MRKLTRLIPACLACCGLSAMADDADLFKQLDTSGDGVIEKSEVDEERVRFFDRLIRVGDKNEDGKLSLEEFNAALVEPEAESPQRGPMNRGGRRGFSPPGGFEMPSPEELVERLDTNKDGKIQRDELNDRAQMLGRLMDRLDTDELTKEQLEQAARRMREMMAARGDRPEGDRPEMEGRPERRPYGPPREGERREGDRRPETDGDRPPRGPEMADRDGDRFRPREDFRPRGDESDFRPREGQGRREGDGPRDGGGPRGDDMARRGEGRPDGPPPGFGGRGQMGGPPIFRMLDEDGDGKISKLESVRLVELFGELDRNDDGSLDPAELMGFGPGQGPMGPPPFARRDGDRPEGGPMEGRPPRDELGPGPGPRGEGRPPRPEGDRPDDARPEPREGGRPGFGRSGRGPFGGDPAAFFARLDRDENGELTKEELPEFMADRFESMDRNDDGKVTIEDFRRPEGDREGDGPPRRRPNRPELESDDKE